MKSSKNLSCNITFFWDSNSHSSKAKDASTTSTSQGSGKCYNIDLNAYSTNLANMEAMRKKLLDSMRSLARAV